MDIRSVGDLRRALAGGTRKVEITDSEFKDTVIRVAEGVLRLYDEDGKRVAFFFIVHKMINPFTKISLVSTLIQYNAIVVMYKEGKVTVERRN